ncbi:hypothetical protein FQN51_008496 [Onygenales sp. PD_10]|nr:hypothetical protein FQN51_008496 [Onygenales sp. PD_10]
MPPRPRTLLLTLDAFNTLFHPRLPVPIQYAQVAQSLHFPPQTTDNPSVPTADLAAQISTAFRVAYKQESAARPNFGRNVPGFGGPKEWWRNVIRGCFARVVEEREGGGNVEVPEELVDRLIRRFESKEGYTLYPDVGEFFGRMRRWRAGNRAGSGTRFERVVVGVVSNSDDRIASILNSLGVRVGGYGSSTSTSSAAGSGRGVPADIDFIVTSYEAGEEKPHRAIFDFAKERAKQCLAGNDFSPSNDVDWTYVHVGDHYEKDYIGATDAGWDSYLLPRDGDGPGLQELPKDYPRTVKRIGALSDLFPNLGIDTA